MGKLKESTKYYGFIRLAASSPKLRVADPEYNTAEILKILKQAEKNNIDLVVFPELCLSSYSCGDMFLQKNLLDAVLLKLIELKNFSAKLALSFIVGLPLMHNYRLYNVAAFISNGKILGLVPKSYVPNTQEYYEKRWFSSGEALQDELLIDKKPVIISPNTIFQSNNNPRFSVAIEICEDLWVPIPPSSKACLAGALIIANLSASSAVIGKKKYRQNLVIAQSSRCISSYIYAGAGCFESTSEMLFDSHLMIYENGKILSENDQLTSDTKMIYSDSDLDLLANMRLKSTAFQDSGPQVGYQKIIFEEHLDNQADAKNLKYPLLSDTAFVPKDDIEIKTVCHEIMEITTNALKKRLAHTQIKKILIGISGGLDSTLAILLCHKTLSLLEDKNVGITAVTMPGLGTSNITFDNATQLCKALDVELMKIDITDLVNAHLKKINWKKSQTLVLENAQARERTQILMNLANQKSGIVVGTSDLSEMALGWSTYGGDQLSMYHICAGIPKTLIKSMIKYFIDTIKDINLKTILLSILKTPISPELLPTKDKSKITQLTETSIGSYVLHDFFLFHMLNYGHSPKKIYYLAKQAFSDISEIKILTTLKIFYERFFKNQFKRVASPDAPKIGTICLSPRSDLRIPSDISVALWRKELDHL